MSPHTPLFSLFFFNDTATTEIYTLSLHDALPIFRRGRIIGNTLCRAGGKRTDSAPVIPEPAETQSVFLSGGEVKFTDEAIAGYGIWPGKGKGARGKVGPGNHAEDLDSNRVKAAGANLSARERLAGQRIDGCGSGRAEVSYTLCCCRRERRGRLSRLMDTESLVFDEKEKAVLEDWPAEGGAEVMRSQQRLRHAEIRQRIEGVVADEFPGGTVQLVAAGLGYGREDCGAPPILGGHAGSDNLNLLNCVRGGQLNSLAAMGKIHASRIELNVCGVGAVALDVHALLVAIDVVASTHMFHPRGVVDGLDDVAGVDGHFLDQLSIHPVAECA